MNIFELSNWPMLLLGIYGVFIFIFYEMLAKDMTIWDRFIAIVLITAIIGTQLMNPSQETVNNTPVSVEGQ